VALAYTIYVLRSGLGRRVRLDKVRLRGLLGRGQARRGALNIVLYWVFFIAMLTVMVSGGLLYFGFFAGYDVATLHWYATWVILGFSGLHVLSHFGIGGVSQLFRIFRPTGLTAPPPQLDAAELLAMLVEQSSRLQPETKRLETIAPEARLQPAQREPRAELTRREARPQPAPRETRMEPMRREMPPQPAPRGVRMEPKRREMPPQPALREARAEPMQREVPLPPALRKVLMEPTQREVPPQPSPREARMEPTQREVPLQPALQVARMEPTQRQVPLHPAQREAQVEPMRREMPLQPAPREAQVEPTQREVPPQPAPREARVEPMQREVPPQPAPREARVESMWREVLLQPKPREARVEPTQREVPVQPAPREARVEPMQRKMPLQPAPQEARVEPLPREVLLQPVQREERKEPMQREMPPQPAPREARVEPLPREVLLQPVQREERKEPMRREMPLPPALREARVELMRREMPLPPAQREERMEPMRREMPLLPAPREARVEPMPREVPLPPAQREQRMEPMLREVPLQPAQREPRVESMLRFNDITRGRPAARHSAAPSATARSRTSKPRNPTFQSNPFVVAAAVAITGASIIVATDRLAVDQLQIHRIASVEAPVLDGDTSDRAWRNVQPFSVMTSQGGNFDGKGETKIDIRAVHDGTWAYFLFTWEDPTRSLKQLPLIKEIDGWHLLQNGHETGDEHDYNEDKFSVLLTTLDVTLAGDRTFHASPHPIPDAPATMTGRGLHFTMSEGVYADVWQWKATSGGPTGWMDDDHFGPPLDPTPMQVSNVVPYKGGFSPDPGVANYTENFVIGTAAVGGDRMITPRRLPKSLAATTAAMGEIDIDPNHGESDGARWFMTEAESVPYSPEQDARVPVGTVIPGVVVAGDFSGDRADVRCAARWASGHWALEVARRLDTNSRYDIPLQTGVFMRVAAFDHNQIRHTRHVRPIRLEVE
jgi:ethylbenzene dehydrogenase